MFASEQLKDGLAFSDTSIPVSGYSGLRQDVRDHHVEAAGTIDNVGTKIQGLTSNA